MSTAPAFILLFDGECGFCDGAVRWLLARDPLGRLRFAPLQGETAAALRARHPQIPGDLDTAVLVERAGGDERVHLRSQAVLRTLALVQSPWRHAAWLRVLPRWLVDAAYRAFARRRYRWFERLDACRVPTPEERARFLE
jgi:predicted DCC family thiol-disulfide oxidoreductase YuxK